MIYNVTGSYVHHGKNFAVLEVGGFGIKIFTSKRVLEELGSMGRVLKMYSFLAVREDGIDLYGFPSEQELQFFELLISVNGVGPKLALAVLDVADLAKLSAAIQENRPDLLAQASGIGQKTAERIIVELKNKVHLIGSEAVVKGMETDADLIEALGTLGYRRDQAKAALGKVGNSVSDPEARLKSALKILSGRQ